MFPLDHSMRRWVRGALYGGLTAVALALAYSALMGPQGLPALREKWDEVRRLEQENDRLRREIEIKKQRIQDLESNPLAQDDEVRKRSGKQRLGERTFILPDERLSGSGAQPNTPPQK